MEETIHYKFVDERLTKEEEYITMSTDVPFWAEIDEPNEPPIIREVKAIKTIELTVDELKKAMANNEDVTIRRETIIVCEDPIKKTVSFKKYFFSKSLVIVKNLKRKKFKITNKFMHSLTINKETGDYSIYSRTKNNKTPFVRKNVLNDSVKNKIFNLFTVGGNSTETHIAISKFYEILGYPPNMLRYTDMVKYFFNIDIPNYSNESSLMMFPFLNYLNKNNIKIKSYFLLYPFYSIFHKNKKKYHNGHITDYFADYYDIKNKHLVNSLLDQLILVNQREFFRHYTDKQNNDTNSTFLDTSKENKKVQYTLYTLDPLMCKLLETSDNPIGQIFGNHHVLFKNVTDSFYSKPNSYIFDILKMYNIGFNDAKNMDNLIQDCKMLLAFREFGVKPKIMLTHRTDDDILMLRKIFDALCFAKNVSGVSTVNENFFKRLNRFLDKNETIHFFYGGKTKSGSISDFIRPNQTYKQLYDWDSPMINLTVIKKNKQEFDQSFVLLRFNKFNAFTTQKNANSNDMYQIRGSEFNSTESKIERALNRNQNNILDNLEIRHRYSKKIFESECEKLTGIPTHFLVDYLD